MKMEDVSLSSMDNSKMEVSGLAYVFHVIFCIIRSVLNKQTHVGVSPLRHEACLVVYILHTFCWFSS